MLRKGDKNDHYNLVFIDGLCDLRYITLSTIIIVKTEVGKGLLIEKLLLIKGYKG